MDKSKKSRIILMVIILFIIFSIFTKHHIVLRLFFYALMFGLGYYLGILNIKNKR